MIFPTIGLIQVGEQGMADRYTYLAMVGLLMMVAWALGDLAVNRPWMAPLSAALAGAALLFCAGRTVTQIAYWRDTITLFGHAADLSRDNYLAYYNLGCFLAKKGDRTNAMAYFERSIDGNPRNHRAYNNLAFLQIDQGQFDQAITNLLEAVRLRPDYPEAWLNLGRAYDARGDAADARRAFETSLARDPDLAEARYRLGDLLLRQGAFPAGVSNLQSAVDLQPRAAKYRLKLANAWVASHQLPKAVDEYEVALKLDPDLAEACNNLAWIMATSPDAALRDGALAVEVARHAVQLTNGKNPLLLGTFAAALAESGAFDQAADAAAQARQLAASQTNNALAAALAAQVELYRGHQAFRDVTVK
jgi:tetratricopeptide (TPR) repeat protein